MLNLQQLSQVELRQICYFLAVIEADNNFSRAAERLQIEQPPLSQRIRALEKMLKVELFDRKRRPLQLTDAGRVFLEEAQLVVTHLNRAIVKAQEADRGERGWLAVGISSSITNTILPDLLREFRQRRPGVELELRELTVPEQIQELRDRRIHTGFETILNPHSRYPSLQTLEPDLQFLPILDDPLIVVIPEKHPLATQAQIPLKTLMSEPLILPPLEAVPYYQEFVHLCHQAGFHPKIVQNIKATWAINILSLVAGEVGLAILPSSVQTLQRKGVVYRMIEDVNLIKQIAIVWRRDDSSPVLHEFLQVVKDVAEMNRGSS
jgi:DNA-binding transcriptional LysR family regulator